MSETIAEWLIVWAFFFLVMGFTVAEARWLSQKGWATFGRGLAFAGLTNLIGYAVGFFIGFLAFIILMMIVFEPAMRNSQTQSNLSLIISGIAILSTPMLLIICKRLFISIFKMQSGKSAWLYALASSVLSLIISFGIPVGIAYFYYR